jgi:predicted RNA-binding Zn ribbon-like protein
MPRVSQSPAQARGSSEVRTVTRAPGTPITSPRASRQIRDGFKFRTGHLALDLTATLTGRARVGPTDLLNAPTDLDRWCVAAQLCDEAPRVAASALELAHTLRESLFRLALARVNRTASAAADIAIVNNAALAATPAPQLAADGVHVARATTEGLLAVIARAGIELLGSSAADRLKLCEGAGCSVLFLDSSRAGERRWCSMAACGNRAKLAEFRSRKSRAERQ